MSVTWSPARWYLFGLIMLCALAVGSLLWYQHTESDPQGNANVNCTKTDLEPITGANGIVASGHNTVCDGFGGDSAVYIYVHRAKEREDSHQLVLRYSERTDWDLPKIDWTDGDHLTIRIKHAIQITKKVTTVEGVTISYEINQEDYPSVSGPKE